MAARRLLFVVLIAVSAVVCGAQARAAEVSVDFGAQLRPWDGFGVNYVETHQTRDYDQKVEDYGGFSLMSETERRQVIELTFGEEGLKPGLLKMFLDPFHQGMTKPAGLSDNPNIIQMETFDHEKTTRWMRMYAREGLKTTRARGGDLQVIVTMYGPAPWLTKQKIVRGRDLDPAEKINTAKYMISWAKYLRDGEGLPLKYISLHNEGEGTNRWPANGKGPGEPKHDHNCYWPPEQVCEFLKLMWPIMDANGMREVGLTPGETTSWMRFLDQRFAWKISQDAQALAALGLITSHGFMKVKPGVDVGAGVDLLHRKRPELHAWTTSMSWSAMDAAFINDIRRQIYDAKVSGVIPWAAIQRPGQWVGGDPNPGCAFQVAQDGRLTVTAGYHFFKQASRAGQPGMAVARVESKNKDLGLIAFAAAGTSHPDAFVLINTGQDAKEVDVAVKGTRAQQFATFRTTSGSPDRPGEKHQESGKFGIKGGKVVYTAPPGSVTTFYAVLE